MSECGQKYRKTRKTKKINVLFFLLYPLPFILYSLFFRLPHGALQAPPGALGELFRSESQTLQIRPAYAPGGIIDFRYPVAEMVLHFCSTPWACRRYQGSVPHLLRNFHGHEQKPDWKNTRYTGRRSRTRISSA